MTSRWGKLNRGQSYGILADDVALRLSTVHLTDYERLLIEYVRVRTWGPATKRKRRGEFFPDPFPLRDTMDVVAENVSLLRLDASELQRLKKRFYDARRSLLAAKILVMVDHPARRRQGADKGLLINADCDQWVVGDREILPSHIAEPYARSMQNSDWQGEDQVDRDDEHQPAAAADLLEASPLATSEVVNGDLAGRERRPPGRERRPERSSTATSQVVNGDLGNRPPRTPLIGTHASEDFPEEKSKKTPLPPEDGGPGGPGGFPDHPVNFGSDFEAAVYRMVLGARDRSATKELAHDVLLQFRARLAEGHTPAAVHSSYLGARGNMPTRPAAWSNWVETNLRRRKAEADPVPAAGPVRTPEYIAAIKALREQKYTRYDRP